MLSLELHGRRKIYTKADEITRDNVISELLMALTIHEFNVAEEDFLYWYRRGIQPILERTKDIRPEICHRVLINNAAMITDFHNGYFLTKPANYVSRKEDETITESVKKLNEYLFTSGKHLADNKVVDWFHTVGVGALYVEPNKEDSPSKPANVYALDPRSAFCVYSLNPGNKPIYGVNVVIYNNQVYIDVVTRNKVFKIESASMVGDYEVFPPLHAFPLQVVEEYDNPTGEIYIIEYEHNANRMGAFESVISIMDSINETESMRQDGIDQFIQSLVVLYNCELEEGTTADEIRKAGLVKLKNVGENKADIKILSEELDQTQTQTTLKDLYEQMLEKSSVPSSVRDGASTSDNVGAVYLRSGWAMADTHARNTEDHFKAANKYFDRVFLKIVEAKTGLKLDENDFELCFARNSMENVMSKAQAALNMKELGLAPEIVLERSGLSSDPLADIEVSKKYMSAKWETNEPFVEVVDENGY